MDNTIWIHYTGLNGHFGNNPLRHVFHYIEFNFPFNFQNHFTLPGNFLVLF